MRGYSRNIGLTTVFCLMLGPAYAFSLAEAIHLGLTENPEIQRLKESHILQQEGVVLQKEKLNSRWQWVGQAYQTIYGPSLRTGPAWNWQNSIGTQMHMTLTDGIGVYAGPSASLEVDQPLLRGAGSVVNTAALFESEQQLRIHDLDEAEIRSRRALLIAQAYYEWQQALYQWDLQQKEHQSLARFAHAIHARITAGRLPAVDAAQADVQLLQHEIQLLDAKRRCEQTYSQLWLEIGIPPPVTPLDARPEPLPELNLAPLAFYQQMAQDQSYVLARLRLEESIAQRNQAVAENQDQIDVSLHAEGSLYVDYNPFIIPNLMAGIVWTVPIGSTLSTRHPVHQAQYQVRNLRTQQAVSRQQLAAHLQQLWDSANSQRQQWQHYHQSIALAHANCQNAQKKLEAGRQSIFEVIALCEQEARVESGFYDLQLRYIQTVYALEEAAGLWMQRWEGEAANAP